MGLFSFLKKKNRNYSSDAMISIANEWVEWFISGAPSLVKRTYNKDEIYMFCAWILIDWSRNANYLTNDSNINSFFETIFQAVRNTGTYQQSDMEQFQFRVSQYKWQVQGMLECDYPRTPMFLPETLFARLTNIDFDNFPPSEIDDDNLFKFTDYIGSFWNKVNRDIMKRFPR